MNEIDILKELGEAACYEQLAEEAAELAQAALKVARILRGVNPTPLKMEEARANLKEEYNDVMLVGGILGCDRDYYILTKKYDRWVSRIKEAKNGERV